MVFIPIGIVALMILGKLFSIQFIEGSELRAKAEEEVIREIPIRAKRGNIYSSDGKLLATSMPVYDVHFDPVSVASEDFEPQHQALSQALASLAQNPDHHIKPLSANAWEEKFRSGRNNGQRYILVAKKVSFRSLQKIKALPIFKLGRYKGGLIIEQENIRKTPLEQIAERTIGYGASDNSIGLEGAYASYLRGKDGRRLKQKIGQGNWKPLFDLNELEPENGYDLVSTIDTRFQDLAHNALLRMLEEQEADHGCAVVMEVETGAIRAIANLGRTEEGKYFERRNYAVWESTEPGSTFKLATMLALLEDGHLDLDDTIRIESQNYRYYDAIIRDSHREDSVITVREAFEHSSNVGMAKKVIRHYEGDRKRFFDRFYQIGLHKPLGLPIKGEGKPKLPSPDESGWKIAYTWASFGYQVSFTPLQILSLYNAVANQGKMLKPRFVERIEEHGRTLETMEPEILHPAICSQETLEKLQSLLEGVVLRGTAKARHKSEEPICRLAGKTGTCQLNYWKKEEIQHQASFVGYFPADKPKYSCIVVINKPQKNIYGSQVAYPVFKEIAESIYISSPAEVKIEKMDPEPHPTPSPKNWIAALNQNRMPNLKGLNGHEVLSGLENANFQVRINGSGKVLRQYPAPGTRLSNKLVKLELQ